MRGMDHQQRRPTVLLEIPLALAAVRTSASSSVPYHAMKRAWQLSQWISARFLGCRYLSHRTKTPLS